MSLTDTKAQLVQLLADEDNKVVALSGKWGTGKTYMLAEVRKASSNERVRDALHASLFGLASIDQLKLKLIQSVVPMAERNPAVLNSAKQIVNSGIKVLAGFHDGFSALTDIGLVVAPAILRKKVIVLDDIERKHDSLAIDEILGFIDEFTQLHECRFVLVLNTDQLANREVWDKLREKVVDEEVKLATRPDEAFDIALQQTQTDLEHHLRRAVNVCGVTNIRIIRKIIKAANRIMAGREQARPDVLARAVPSIALLSAIHYKGIEDGPTHSFVLSLGTSDDVAFSLDKEKTKSEEGQRRAGWKSMIQELGIYSADDFELCVVEYLDSGLLDVSKVSAIVDRYVREEQEAAAIERSHQLFDRIYWDASASEQELTREAEELLEVAHLLNPYTITTMSDVLHGLKGGDAVAEAFVDKWLVGFREKNKNKPVAIEDFWRRKLHPDIEAEFHSTNEIIQSATSAYDACVHVAVHKGWGPRQELALKAATVEEFESILRSRNGQELRRFVLGMADLCAHQSAYEPHFGSAMDHFIIACKRVISDSPDARLAKILRGSLSESGLSSRLEDEEAG